MWAIASNGEPLYREGVRGNCPEGSGWRAVPSDCQFQAVTVREAKVWAVGKDGSAFLRQGISEVSPMGK